MSDGRILQVNVSAGGVPKAVQRHAWVTLWSTLRAARTRVGILDAALAGTAVATPA